MAVATVRAPPQDISAPAPGIEAARNVIVPRRHPGRWLAVVFLAIIALQAAHAVAVNPNFHWDVYLKYLFWPQVIRGVGWTLLITVVAMAVGQKVGIPHEKMNVNGGAVAIGHPIGMTGARLILTALHELRRRGGRYAIATPCIGGGEATAVLLEAL